MSLKPRKQYIFMLEGDTEKWYLEWLQNIINSYESSLYRCVFEYNQPNPLKLCRTLNILNPTNIYAIIDTERASEQEKFKNTLKQMKEAKKSKEIKFKLGYSNISFELWLLLHKEMSSRSLMRQEEYLTHINRTYNLNFQSLVKYKHKDEFKKLLDKLTLSDVFTAIRNAKRIDLLNHENNIIQNFYNFEYYEENPSLSVHNIIEQILKDCGITAAR